MNWRNILERAAWTAVQTALAAIPVAQISAAIVGGDIDAFTQLALSGLGAGIGAGLSFLKTVAQERLAALAQQAEQLAADQLRTLEEVADEYGWDLPTDLDAGDDSAAG